MVILQSPDTNEPQSHHLNKRQCHLVSEDLLPAKRPKLERIDSTVTNYKRIQELAKQGGPDLSDLRGYPEPININMPSSQTSERSRKRALSHTTSTSSKSSSPYDRNFQQHLIDNNILPDDYEYPDGTEPPEPENITEICEFFNRRRGSLSELEFTEQDFRKLRREDRRATKETQVMKAVLPIIEGDIEDISCVVCDTTLTNFEPLTDGTLVAAKPDQFIGARPEALAQHVRAELDAYIVPSTQSDLPILPNFFLEVKGPDGSPGVANRQLIYDMAFGERGMCKLHQYASPDSGPINYAHTVGCIYQDGQLKMYITSALDSPPGFVATKLKSWSVTGDVNTCREAISWFRNAREWAKQERDRLIKAANSKMKRAESGTGLNLKDGTATDPSDPGDTATTPSTPSPIADVDTSADELAPSPVIVRPPTMRRKSVPVAG